MDIDDFKAVNDSFGHPAGDFVLKELGRLLKKRSRSSDIACRHGGDEFVVVMPKASADNALNARMNGGTHSPRKNLPLMGKFTG